MDPNPLRLLLHGYGLALAGATALAASGGGGVAAALVFWLGGAAATLALGALAVRRGAVAETGADDQAFAQALRRWEEDRLADSSAAQDPAADAHAADALRR